MLVEYCISGSAKDWSRYTVLTCNVSQDKDGVHVGPFRNNWVRV